MGFGQPQLVLHGDFAAARHHRPYSHKLTFLVVVFDYLLREVHILGRPRADELSADGLESRNLSDCRFSAHNITAGSGKQSGLSIKYH